MSVFALSSCALLSVLSTSPLVGATLSSAACPASRPNHVHQDQMHGSTYRLSLSADMYQAMTAQHAHTLACKPNLVSNGHDNNDCMAHVCQLG